MPRYKNGMKLKWVKMIEKKQTYLVTVAVLEGRHYAILNMDSAVVVRIGDQKKTTNLKPKSDCPFYNEYFVFEFHTTHDKMMDMQINICVVQPRTVWRKTKILGCIALDVATVFNQKNHQFYHKWGILQTPKHDPLTGPRGYLKLDMTVMSKGDVPTIPLNVDNEEIEGNLLLADGMFTERQKALYIFDIYKCMHLVGHPSVHISSHDEDKKHPNIYVEITFAGQSVRTSSLGDTEHPEFNERLIIVDLFPPLCQRIKIEVCYEDHIAINKTHHSTRYISLKSISNGSKDGFLPTFGPSLIHLYSLYPLEGYTGTLMMAIKTDLQQRFMTPDSKDSTMVEPIAGIDERKQFNFEHIRMVTLIFDATSICKAYTDKPVSIWMTFGESCKQKFKNYIVNATESQLPRVNKKFATLSFDEYKPCLWIYTKAAINKTVFEYNMLSKIANQLRTRLGEIEKLFETSDLIRQSEDIEAKLIETIDYLIIAAEKFLDISSSHTCEYYTDLDLSKRRICHSALKQIISEATNVFEKSAKKRTFRKMQRFNKMIDSLVEDGEEILPDMFLWLVYNNKKVAFTQIPARDIIYSSVEEERGNFCGIKRSICFTQHDHPTTLLCKMDVLITLFMDRYKAEAIEQLPEGFVFSADLDSLPLYCIAQDKTNFTIRAHIFQGRITTGFDRTGLADPFVRVIAGDQCRDTYVFKGCLNPVWNQMLVFENVFLYGPKKFIQERGKSVLLEVFDKEDGKNELIGRTILHPNIITIEEVYVPPKLEWTDVYRGEDCTASILCACEFIEAGQTSTIVGPQTKAMTEIPKEIKPELASFRIDVLFWGVRDLKKINLRTINKPKITVMCRDETIHSETIENARKNPNFDDNRRSLTMEMAVQKEFTPPLILKMFDSRTFGIYVYAGVYVTDVSLFLFTPMSLAERQKRIGGFGYVSEDSLISRESVDSDEDEKSIVPMSEVLLQEPENESRFKKWLKPKFLVNKLQETVSEATTYEPLPQEDKLDTRDFDWWTKFYASIGEGSQMGDEDFVKKVQTLKIYDSELEKQPEFKGFTDKLTTFEMYKGKRTGDDTIDEEKVTGLFKGCIKIYQWPLDDGEEYVTPEGNPLSEGYFKRFSDNTPMGYTLRVYCVRAMSLRPKDITGKSDPYLVLALNDKVINDRDHYVVKQVNPIFGRCFEFIAAFPFDHNLKISVYDYDKVTGDDLIGETKIDIECRYYTKHRAAWGIPENYEEEGYCEWKGQQRPTAILEEICRSNNICKPEYSAKDVTIGFKRFGPRQFEPSEDPDFDKEVLALCALRHWHEMPGVGYHLVPEYVETRSLYDPSKPGIEQGKLQLWIDILPITELPSPMQVDIAPRKPIQYELRVIIWNVENVMLDEDDFFSGERKSDIYVKGWLSDSENTQMTDVHYRSISGEGNFNWRFIFPFQYLPTENRMVMKRKDSRFALDETEYKIPCQLTLQVWDNDTFSQNDFLGTLTLELSRMKRGAKTAKKCHLKLMDKGAPVVNLFRIKRTRGWWPFRNFHHKTNADICTGKVEAEMEVVTQDEALLDPAGLGRREPQALPPPKKRDAPAPFLPLPAETHFLRHITKNKLKISIVAIVIALLIGAVLIFYPRIHFG